MNAVLPFLQNKARKQNVPPFFKDVRDVVGTLKPCVPTYVLNPAQIAQTATHFMTQFPGKTLFAVKTNPHRAVIETLARAGMTAFDVASLPEIQLVHSIAPDAELFFMHTVKAPETIRIAYFDYGVRNFSLDHEDELAKIIDATGHADDLTLFVRVALPKNDNAAIDFSSKFGALPAEAITLLQKVRPHAKKLGVCFHVGTQTADAGSYGNAINTIKGIIRDCGVRVDALDIGGGFPVPYEGEDVPSITSCLNVVKTALYHAGLDHLELLAEPGRCLVAQGGSLIVRVELRKGDLLYINDGTYGGLFDAGSQLRTPFPVQALRPDGGFSGAPEAFRLAGPTCDSLDMMEGPFMLPADIKTGDWIEIKNTGAYSQALRTDFNGFGVCETVFVQSH